MSRGQVKDPDTDRRLMIGQATRDHLVDVMGSGWVTTSQAAAKSGLTPHTTLRHLHYLADAGVVERRNLDGRAFKFRLID